MSITKKYITADELLLDSFKLGVDIFNSGFRPNFIVGVWRGGTPVGIAIQEILAYLGNESDHIAIRTSSYIGINNQSKEVRVHGIDYLISNMNAEDSLLLVDDVFDSGRSIKAILDTLNEGQEKIYLMMFVWRCLGISPKETSLILSQITIFMKQMTG